MSIANSYEHRCQTVSFDKNSRLPAPVLFGESISDPEFLRPWVGQNGWGPPMRLLAKNGIRQHFRKYCPSDSQPDRDDRPPADLTGHLSPKTPMFCMSSGSLVQFAFGKQLSFCGVFSARFPLVFWPYALNRVPPCVTQHLSAPAWQRGPQTRHRPTHSSGLGAFVTSRTLPGPLRRSNFTPATTYPMDSNASQRPVLATHRVRPQARRALRHGHRAGAPGPRRPRAVRLSIVGFARCPAPHRRGAPR